MASPNAVFSELVVTTLRNHRKELIDNISKNNALLRYLTRKGTTILDGGLSIVQPMDYAENTTYQRYSGYDVLNVAASDVITATDYPWRQIAINVTASGMELRANSGENRIINLVKARVKNAIRTFKNNFSADLYSDGTLPNQITGLQAQVSDTGLGTVGGIDSAAWPFWRNQVQSAAAPIQGGAGIPVDKDTLETQLMLPFWLSLVRGDDAPNLIITDNTYYALYEASQVPMKRYTEGGAITGGLPALKYKTADVIYDGGSGIPARHMYFLNTEYLELVVHRDANMEVMDKMRPFNQDAAVIPILWMGNFVCTNRKLQGVLKA